MNPLLYKQYKPGISILTLTICFITNSQAVSTKVQPHESIYQGAQQFINMHYATADINSDIGKLDPRLKLSLCPEPLDIFWPQNHKRSGHTTLGVRCLLQPMWKIYLPVTIRIYKKIATAKQTLKRGEILGHDDITWERREISGLYQGYLENIEEYIGQITTRLITIHQPILPQALAPIKLIKRGENVILLAKLKGIEVRISGTALSDGSLSDMIKIRNLMSNRIIEGKVVAKGMAQIDM